MPNEQELLKEISRLKTRISELEKDCANGRERLYGFLEKNMVDLLWTTDLALTFTYVSPSVKNILGFSPDEINGKNISVMLTPASLAEALRAFESEMQVEASGRFDPLRIRVFEYEHKRKDGTVIVCEVRVHFLRDEAGKAVGVLGVSRDVSDRKRLHYEIVRTAREWNETFNAISDLVFIQDKDFTITRANKACLAILKLTPDQIIGKKCYEVLHKRTSPWVGCPFEKTRSDGKAHVEEVDDPEIGIPLLVTASPIFDPSGQFIGTVHIAKDISEIRKTHNELKNKIKELETFQRLTMGREKRIMELKDEIKRLKGISGRNDL